MIVLGVDLGDRRVGFAVTDEKERLAVPSGHAAVRTRADALAAVLAKARAEGAGLAVIGNPLNMNGRPGPKAREAAEFRAGVEASGLAAVLWDERLTTAEAARRLKEAGLGRMRRKSLIDANSAQRILESFIAFRNRGA